MIRVQLVQKNKVLELPAPLSVGSLLTKIGAKMTTTVVMRDEKILTPDITLQEGDRVEIISVVSGG